MRFRMFFDTLKKRIFCFPLMKLSHFFLQKEHICFTVETIEGMLLYKFQPVCKNNRKSSVKEEGMSPLIPQHGLKKIYFDNYKTYALNNRVHAIHFYILHHKIQRCDYIYVYFCKRYCIRTDIQFHNIRTYKLQSKQQNHKFHGRYFYKKMAIKYKTLTKFINEGSKIII